MRLLRTHPIELVEFTPDRIPDYAILSHTWGEEEVLFTNMQNCTGQTRSAWSKVQGACAQARADGFDYIWIDTCCIDKSSSAELSEAINSMFTWYANAAICYAYLSDVTMSEGHSGAEVNTAEFERSRWFTRGWTLQELLAPSEVVFFSRDWVRFGKRSSLANWLMYITRIDKAVLGGEVPLFERSTAQRMSWAARRQITRPEDMPYCLMDITRIDEAVLSRKVPLFERSIAQRMSWAARRQTTRPEDMAYCLMGIFSVNMPMLYGEGGEKAFLRLQEEIMKQSDDQTIFAWTNKRAPEYSLSGLLATTPAHFEHSQDIIAYQQWEPTPPYAMTNRGLRIDLPLHDLTPDIPGHDIIALLRCGVSEDIKGQTGYKFLAIGLTRISNFDNRYARRDLGSLFRKSVSSRMQTIYVPQTTFDADMKGPLGHVIFDMWGYPRLSQYRLIRIASPTVDREIEKIHLDLTSRPTENLVVFSSLNPTGRHGTILAFLIWQHPDKNKPQIVVMVGSSPDFSLGFDATRYPDSDSERFNFDELRSLVGEKSNLQPIGQKVKVYDLIISVEAIKRKAGIPRHYSLGVSIEEEQQERTNSALNKFLKKFSIRSI
ncbi:heterokaryon incompatibility protein-domain-containing protein [Aspergillus sergii]|uniref:Heterokaryon incompatibility protein-domain-containing protein n=1 Tax=Aspergillus sergii TaxID=1034303 RepID=A0A5N6XAR5_9EURO|nr:heterokaryon incompatibility protein-domain-containing protein [Aspergillus sergii]